MALQHLLVVSQDPSVRVNLHADFCPSPPGTFPGGTQLQGPETGSPLLWHLHGPPCPMSPACLSPPTSIILGLLLASSPTMRVWLQKPRLSTGHPRFRAMGRAGKTPLIWGRGSHVEMWHLLKDWLLKETALGPTSPQTDAQLQDMAPSTALTPLPALTPSLAYLHPLHRGVCEPANPGTR